jgi:uncharacterized protein
VLLDPPILFFALGFFSVLLKSDIDIPSSISRFLALYLLFAIGLKGGVSLASSGLDFHSIKLLLAAVFASLAIPIYSYAMLRWKFSRADAAAIAAAYGSVSAVTFMAGVSFLEQRSLEVPGYMVAALALMESPAIILAMVMMRGGQGGLKSFGPVVRDALLNGSVFLLLGSLCIGFLVGESGSRDLQVFVHGMFKGFLSFFLLDMGINAAREWRKLSSNIGELLFFGLLFPLLNGSLGVGLALLTGATVPEAFLLVILCASASYIAVPAAMRVCNPEASPSLYLTAALGITFPFNILVGMWAYWWVLSQVAPFGLSP